MRARIHRGAHEIGGNCIELEAVGLRLVLDIGWPLTVPAGEDVPLPAVAGLDTGNDPTFAAVIISHPHPDHFGLLPKVADSVRLYMGEAAANILKEAAFFSPFDIDLEPAGFLRHRQTFEIGPFKITPYLNDHSAFDAYSLLIEAKGKRLFYTGDIRGHGWKKGIFEELLRKPPEGIDVLLMEGTHIREESDGAERGPTEKDVEKACVKTFRDTEGLVLAMFSPQNIDRLVTMYRACLQSGRDLVIDLYTAAIANATGLETIPQAEWDRVRVYLPRSQKSRVVCEKAFHRTDAVWARRVYPEEIKERAGELVMLFRGSMARELQQIGCLAGAVVWSMWPGYLQEASGKKLKKFLDEQGIPMVIHHSSGHAYIPDLKRLVEALDPRRVVPIHSLAGDRFEEFFPRVDGRPDGAWWEL